MEMAPKPGLACAETLPGGRLRTIDNIPQEDLRERILIMRRDETSCRADPYYIERRQKHGMTSNFRRRITEWMLAVRPPRYRLKIF